MWIHIILHTQLPVHKHHQPRHDACAEVSLPNSIHSQGTDHFSSPLCLNNCAAAQWPVFHYNLAKFSFASPLVLAQHAPQQHHSKPSCIPCIHDFMHMSTQCLQKSVLHTLCSIMLFLICDSIPWKNPHSSPTLCKSWEWETVSQQCLQQLQSSTPVHMHCIALWPTSQRKLTCTVLVQCLHSACTLQPATKMFPWSHESLFSANIGNQGTWVRVGKHGVCLRWCEFTSMAVHLIGTTITQKDVSSHKWCVLT